MSESTSYSSRSIIVLGMHRSGTSALTGVLSYLGADAGTSLIPGIEGINPKGFWEHGEVVNTHDSLLTALGSSWDDERPLPDEWWHSTVACEFRKQLEAILRRDFDNSPLWIMKDPRICRLLPLWLGILKNLNAEPHFVICLRHPSEVARSLEVRDGIVRRRAYLLWLAHLLESERCTRGQSRVIVTYEDLVRDWQSVARQIIETLRLPIKTSNNNALISDFVEPSLKHHTGPSNDDETDETYQLAICAYNRMLAGDVDQLDSHLNLIARQASEVIEMATPWITQIQRLNHRVAELRMREASLHRIESELLRIKSTFSWRITKPLRLLEHLSSKKDIKT